ncbi:MAG: glycerophosphodiester phosphodiesterase [Blastomonas sp.]
MRAMLLRTGLTVFGLIISAALMPVPALAHETGAEARRPLVIAHRGASGARPEHTLAAYEVAIDEGADYVEPDLVISRDGVLIVRHEHELSGTTDIADHPEFDDRKVTKTIDGKDVTGWFSEDFTLAELKTLRAREPMGAFRPLAMAFDDLYPIATFSEVIQLVKAKQVETGRVIGIYPETKHPSYFESIGMPLEGELLRILREEAGYEDRDDPVFIQSFEIANLKALRSQTKLRLLQLAAVPRGATAGPRADVSSAEGIAEIASYADAIGAEKPLVIALDDEGNLGAPTQLVERAHALGLEVHIWTLRRENRYLPRNFRMGAAANGTGDLAGEVAAFVAAGVDGLISDNVAETVAALDGQ